MYREYMKDMLQQNKEISHQLWTLPYPDYLDIGPLYICSTNKRDIDEKYRDYIKELKSIIELESIKIDTYIIMRKNRFVKSDINSVVKVIRGSNKEEEIDQWFAKTIEPPNKYIRYFHVCTHNEVFGETMDPDARSDELIVINIPILNGANLFEIGHAENIQIFREIAESIKSYGKLYTGKNIGKYINAPKYKSGKITVIPEIDMVIEKKGNYSGIDIDENFRLYSKHKPYSLYEIYIDKSIANKIESKSKSKKKKKQTWIKSNVNKSYIELVNKTRYYLTDFMYYTTNAKIKASANDNQNIVMEQSRILIDIICKSFEYYKYKSYAASRYKCNITRCYTPNNVNIKGFTSKVNALTDDKYKDFMLDLIKKSVNKARSKSKELADLQDNTLRSGLLSERDSIIYRARKYIAMRRHYINITKVLNDLKQKYPEEVKEK